MTDVENQPVPSKIEGESSVSAFAPPPYPTGPVAMYPPPQPFGTVPMYPPPQPLGPTDTVFTQAPPPYGPPTSFVQPPYPPVQNADIVVFPQDGTIVNSMPVQITESENIVTLNTFVVSAFDDKVVRRAFIRKVFSVVTLQLLVTFSIVCIFTFSETVKKAVQTNLWIYLSSYIIFMVVALALSFSTTLSRKHPWNMIALAIVTLSLSFMVGTVASYHNTTAVIIAMGSTLVISFSVIILSSQSRVDFTICNGILIVLALDLLMFGFFSVFFYNNVLQIVYGSLGALLYALFLAVDCQLVMDREKYGLSPEEYIFASLVIYLDIIMIFLYILMLLGGGSNN